MRVASIRRSCVRGDDCLIRIDIGDLTGEGECSLTDNGVVVYLPKCKVEDRTLTVYMDAATTAAMIPMSYGFEAKVITEEGYRLTVAKGYLDVMGS